MEIIEVKEGNCTEQREPKKIDFPLKGRCLSWEELNTSLKMAEIFGLTNPNGKISVIVDTETGEIIY